MHDVEMEVIIAAVANNVQVERLSIVVIDSDDEETGDQKSLYPYRDFVLPQPVHSKLEEKNWCLALEAGSVFGAALVEEDEVYIDGCCNEVGDGGNELSE
ncbi:hypothetical protein LOK49_LG04G00709 [Camellia lanceoleosa]|uniref:Uncharacterized protein n=1 Tax=Camellia lanceoleosa TaxID=1840588 RepID=A0ACC0I2S2_9ERIC|nr:hypothetical protein LOK49_LG04G00709 [Camellia lanceoleosa]